MNNHFAPVRSPDKIKSDSGELITSAPDFEALNLISRLTPDRLTRPSRHTPRAAVSSFRSTFVGWARDSPRNFSLLDDAARLKGTSDVAHPVWPVATHKGKLTARRLVITFVPTTGRKLGGCRTRELSHGRCPC